MHAEVLAKRGFIKWLKNRTEGDINGLPEDVFKQDIKRKKMYLDRTKYEIVLYSSEVPCGDCLVD